jgi:LmbE family N-acetylglucosaminyl deacetylase
VPEQPLRILVLGAHPDDADLKAGGTSALWCSLGCTVRLVSMTNGQAGHQTEHGPGLARRRRAEAQAAGAVIGATYEVLDHPDGALDDRLDNRLALIRLIRTFRPDLILTHRTTDYHPDHRFTGLLVQDASYLLTVPAVCPDVPHLPRTPVILCFSDAFTKPCPFQPHVLVDIDAQFERVVDMLHCHASQFYEWLPFNAGHLDEVPPGEAERRAWLADRIGRRLRPLADRYRDLLVAAYGEERGKRIRHVEAFEVSEYGAPLDEAARARLFPFVPPLAGRPSFARKEWADLPEES